jgi:hypothetical protein
MAELLAEKSAGSRAEERNRVACDGFAVSGGSITLLRTRRRPVVTVHVR